MIQQAPDKPVATSASDTAPTLFHDGCRLCLDIAGTLEHAVPGLQIVDLGLHPELKSEAVVRGVERLPSLVIGTRVLTISPHSDIDHVGAN